MKHKNKSIIESYSKLINLGIEISNLNVPCHKGLSWEFILSKMYKSFFELYCFVHNNPNKDFEVPASDFYYLELIGKQAVKIGLVNKFKIFPTLDSKGLGIITKHWNVLSKIKSGILEELIDD